MQSSAGLEIEISPDRASDRSGHGGTQSLFNGPESLHLVLGLDQDQAGRIEAEIVEAMAMRVAVIGKAAWRDDEQHWRLPRHAAEKRRDESESRGHVAFALGDDLVQRPCRKASPRQMRIERGKAEAESGSFGRKVLELRQDATQIIHDLGAASIWLKVRGSGWLHDATRSFLRIIEQNGNIARALVPAGASVPLAQTALRRAHIRLSASYLVAGRGRGVR